jgi:hypothetical protein
MGHGILEFFGTRTLIGISTFGQPFHNRWHAGTRPRNADMFISRGRMLRSTVLMAALYLPSLLAEQGSTHDLATSEANKALLRLAKCRGVACNYGSLRMLLSTIFLIFFSFFSFSFALFFCLRQPSQSLSLFTPLSQPFVALILLLRLHILPSSHSYPPPFTLPSSLALFYRQDTPSTDFSTPAPFSSPISSFLPPSNISPLPTDIQSPETDNPSGTPA